MKNKDQILSEITYKAIRSSGPGGQHVNKVSSKIVLIFDLVNSTAFSDVEKERLTQFFSSSINKEGIIQLASDESRSQVKNKKIVTDRFFTLLKDGLYVPKPRKKTKPSKSAITKAKVQKKQLSEKKKLRKKPDIE